MKKPPFSEEQEVDARRQAGAVAPAAARRNLRISQQTFYRRNW